MRDPLDGSIELCNTGHTTVTGSAKEEQPLAVVLPPPVSASPALENWPSKRLCCALTAAAAVVLDVHVQGPAATHSASMFLSRKIRTGSEARRARAERTTRTIQIERGGATTR